MQTNTDWEHIIIIDEPTPPAHFKSFITEDSRRQLLCCGVNHHNWGNTCRHDATLKATGDYMLYLDDDNVYADKDVLKTLEQVTGEWAMFPMFYRGQPTVPKEGIYDANVIIHKRGIAIYTPTKQSTNEYWERGGDQKLGQDLAKICKPQLIFGRPLVLYDNENKYKETVIFK